MVVSTIIILLLGIGAYIDYHAAVIPLQVITGVAICGCIVNYAVLVVNWPLYVGMVILLLCFLLLASGIGAGDVKLLAAIFAGLAPIACGTFSFILLVCVLLFRRGETVRMGSYFFMAFIILEGLEICTRNLL